MSELTDEQREIRTLARGFAEGEIRPHAAAWDEARALDDGVLRALGELGFLGMRIPEEHGGLGFDLGTFLVAVEALSWGDAAVGLTVSIHNGPVTEALLREGTPEQQARFLPSMASGETLAAFALSEEDAGSDARALSTRAEPDGDGWILSGTKKWVTNGGRADVVLVFARTGEGEDDIAAFLVDPEVEGYRVGPREVTLGLRASETVQVHLEGLRVEPERLIGGPSGGFDLALEAIDVGRLGVAAQSLGIAQAALEHARSYALEREQFGRPIARFEAIQFKIAEMALRIRASRALSQGAARRRARREAERGAGQAAGATGADDGLSPRAEAAMAKWMASETAMYVTDEAVQIFGGYGYMRDYPVEKLMRDAKGTEIYEGTNQIMRLLAARDVLAHG